MSKSGKPSKQAEDLVYDHCYTSVSLAEMLSSAENRGKIRRLPVPQLYYGLFELIETEMLSLLPHITQEQWQGILDLALWRKDRVKPGQFLQWSQFLLKAEMPVARKLFRGVDSEIWELSFKQHLKVVVRDTGVDDPVNEDGNWIETPDGAFHIRLPDDPEMAKIFQPLIARLYELDALQIWDLLLSAQARTSIELEEEAYQARRRRMEDFGFQDYFDAISIYAPLYPEESLPKKNPVETTFSSVPTIVNSDPTELMVMQALAQAAQPALLEEIFFVTNKVLSADLVSPDDPQKLKIGIRKTISGINLGLELWSGGNLDRAVQGVKKHPLSTFFRIGYGQLLKLQKEARLIPQDHQKDYLSHLEMGLSRRYPLLAVRTPERIKKRFFRTTVDINRCQHILEYYISQHNWE